MSDAPEFSRPVRLDSLGGQPRVEQIDANEEEREALAVRFGLIAIDRLDATAECVREGDVIDAVGRLVADVVQSCVASAEPVPAHIDEPFRLRFVPAQSLESAAEEVELNEADCDVVGYSGGAIDLGEAVAETLALALDPFPRSPNAEAALREAGVLSEEDAGPFAVLKELKEKLGKA
jgi:uncharacterized metal-binding protein YceD (DUF177 family)